MGNWPQDPEGDMVPILEQSIEVEAAKRRHPSGVEIVAVTNIVLNAQDRCDSCGGAAVYRLVARMETPELTQPTLDFCGHHHRKNFPNMPGWIIAGTNPELA